MMYVQNMLIDTDCSGRVVQELNQPMFPQIYGRI